MNDGSNNRTCGAFMSPRSDRVSETSSLHMTRQTADILLTLPAKLQEIADSVSYLGARTQSLEDKIDSDRVVSQELQGAARTGQERNQGLETTASSLKGTLETYCKRTDEVLNRLLEAQVHILKAIDKSNRDATNQLDSHRQVLKNMHEGFDTLLATKPLSVSHPVRSISVQTSQENLDSMMERVDQAVQTVLSIAAAPGSMQDSPGLLKLEAQTNRVESAKLEVVYDSKSTIEDTIDWPRENKKAKVNQHQNQSDIDDNDMPCKRVKDLISGKILMIHTNRPTGYLANIVDSDLFSAVTCLVILVNTAVIGCQTNIQTENTLWPGDAVSTGWFRPVNLSFLLLFTLELSLRVAGQRLYFFVGKQLTWNYFDVFMLIVSVFEELGASSLGNVSFFRVVRVLRVFRTLRVLRVFRFVGSLRVMISQILASFASLIWAFFLMGMLMYCTACMLCQSVTDWYGRNDNASDPDISSMRKLYGTIPRAMYALILGVSGGMDWQELVEPWMNKSLFVVTILILYVLFVVFGIMNVLTGVFVDRAREASTLDRDLAVQSEQDEIQSYVKALTKELKKINTKTTGQITWPEFEEYCKSEDVKAYFAYLGISVDEAEELFNLLDRNHTGAVKYTEFVKGCLRMKGHASGFAVMELDSHMSMVEAMLKSIAEEVGIATRAILTSTSVHENRQQDVFNVLI